jgi:hypothetical protein
LASTSREMVPGAGAIPHDGIAPAPMSPPVTSPPSAACVALVIPELVAEVGVESRALMSADGAALSGCTASAPACRPPRSLLRVAVALAVTGMTCMILQLPPVRVCYRHPVIR